MKESQTVLLVEDDPDDVLLTQIAFEKARLANPLQIARDGAEAISYLDGEGHYADRYRFPLPILILMDLQMPRVSGFQVLEWLHDHPDLRDIPVTILTSSDHDPYVHRPYDFGAVSYLLKPPNPQTLV